MVYAEADPYLLGYGGYGLGYAGLGYAGIGYAGPLALPVSMPLTCPCPAPTERERLRLSPTSDSDTPDSDMPESDTLELDSRALPVSTLPMFPCLVLLDLFTTERGKPRLSLSTDTDTLISDTDTESPPAMSVCAPTIWELLCLAKKLRNLQEILGMWGFY